MPTRATRRDATRLRLVRHALAVDELHGAADVTHRMLALQAQDFAAGKWALGARAPGTTLSDIDVAIGSGTIVRSWPMRGTLHLVPAVDLKWMQQLTTPRLIEGRRTRLAELGITNDVIERARAVAVESLSGGRELGRAGFLAALDATGIGTDGQRGYHLIGHLAVTGTLCWGPQRGTQQTLVLVDEWVPRRQGRPVGRQRQIDRAAGRRRRLLPARRDRHRRLRRRPNAALPP